MPAWTFSVLTLLAIFWFMLAPKPLGDEPPPLFPGADKIAHGIMFGGFVAMMLLDWQRKHNWHLVWWQRAFTCAILSSVLGILIEYAQMEMGLGRELEYEDMIADSAGAFLVSAFWLDFQRYWLRN